MTPQSPYNFDDLTVEKKCDYLFSMLSEINSELNNLKNKANTIQTEDIEFRLQVVEDFITESYPSVEDLQKLIAIPPKVWAKVLATNTNWHNLTYLEYLYRKSKIQWKGASILTRKQVAYGLRIFEEYELKEGPLSQNYGLFHNM
ncbi:hypothetical protein LJC23_07250, partial [Desulfovibrio sp. OttesenSCG-928-I05]|nr:hypothetical protein [Desulfovibrio sp. OttesenSCG-928-I05]